jgi:hydroxypyruvate isomerase
MLQFCANLSLLFTEVELIDRFKLAKACGFNAVEIQFPYELPAKQIQQCLEAHQLQLILFNVPAGDLMQGGEGLASVPQKQMEFKAALAQAVDYAEYLQPQVINVLAGRCFEPLNTAVYLETFKENLGLALAAFSPLGIKTAFEAINLYDMPHFLIHSGAQLVALWQQLNHPDLGLQYDIYHAARMGENFIDFIQQHSEKIAHLQLADSPGRGQPGTGTLDFNAIFRCIEQSAYQGWIGAEYKPQGGSVNSLAWLACTGGAF